VLVLSIVIGGACALALARGNLLGRRSSPAFMSPLMPPAILTGLALFQSYLLAGIGRRSGA
jgi:putative spermidine/putrescine transport system permease protein